MESLQKQEILDLIAVTLHDSQKKQINHIKRAKLIKYYLESTGLSERKLANKLGIPHSTLQDWLLWAKITQVKYNEQVKLGYSHTQIYRSLRDNKDLPLKKIFKFNCSLDKDLELTTKILNRHIHNFKMTEKTDFFISNLQNTLNRLKMRLNKYR